MISVIGFEDTAAGVPEVREVIAMSASQSLIRRGRRYLLRFASPIEREFELTPKEAFRWCERCGGLEAFADLSREDIVRDVFPYHYRKFLATTTTKEGSR